MIQQTLIARRFEISPSTFAITLLFAFMNFNEKFLLRKRSLIESVFSVLKRNGLEHSRHRSIYGFILHILGSLIAYQGLILKSQKFQEVMPCLIHNSRNEIQYNYPNTIFKIITQMNKQLHLTSTIQYHHIIYKNLSRDSK